ncbi:MAG: YbjN domain-containing protein [Duncaniella sp.]|nr:YbjN domain-containing protein [Duncaniella sp.]
MKTTFPYFAPVTDSQLVYTDGEVMDEAVEAYEQGDYLKSIQLLIDALDGDFREKYGNHDGTRFTIPHGSIVVDIDVSPDMLHISADFLRLPEKGRVAMLRKIAEMNIENLMLARFVKDGDYLKMEYSCPITDTHPHKIHSVLHNICTIGDKYDDELCTRFNAERCYEPKVTPFTPEQVADAYNALQSVGNLALSAAAEYSAQRRTIYAWTIVCGALYQFRFFANPQGQLINELEKAVESMNDERPLEELVSRGVNFLTKLLSVPEEQLAKDLYVVEMMVSVKYYATLASVQDELEYLNDGVTEAMQKKDYDQVAVRIYYMFYKMLVENEMPLLVDYAIVTALRESAGLPLKEAAEILSAALDKIMDGDLEIPVSGDADEEEDEDIDDDEEEEEDDDDGISDEAYANVIAAQQKMAQAMSSEEIIALQRQMDEALKAGNVQEYMRLATELQMRMISNLGS